MFCGIGATTKEEPAGGSEMIELLTVTAGPPGRSVELEGPKTIGDDPWAETV